MTKEIRYVIVDPKDQIIASSGRRCIEAHLETIQNKRLLVVRAYKTDLSDWREINKETSFAAINIEGYTCLKLDRLMSMAEHLELSRALARWERWHPYMVHCIDAL